MMADIRLFNRKKHLLALIGRELNSDDTIIKSIRPNFFERLNAMLSVQRPVLIAISGESASGKTTFVKIIKEQAARIQERRENLILSTIKGDNYFNDISEGIKTYGSFDALLASGYNPDAPSSFQLELMRRDLTQLMCGEKTCIPRYEINGTGVSVPNAVEIAPAEVIMVEGMCSLYDDIHDVFDLKIFVDIEPEVQEARYLSRCKERNQCIEDAKEQLRIVSESAQTYIKPTRKHADIVINGNAKMDNLKTFALDFIKALQEFAPVEQAWTASLEEFVTQE